MSNRQIVDGRVVLIARCPSRLLSLLNLGPFLSAAVLTSLGTVLRHVRVVSMVRALKTRLVSLNSLQIQRSDPDLLVFWRFGSRCDELTHCKRGSLADGSLRPLLNPLRRVLRIYARVRVVA